MSVKTLLKEEVCNEIKELGKLDTTSDGYKIAVDGVSKLLDKVNEMEKMDLEYQERVESREAEINLKRELAKDEKKNHRVQNVLTGTSILGGFALAVWGTYKSFEFEKTGTITTMMGRGFINKLLPKK